MNRIIDIKREELNAVEPVSLDEVKRALIIDITNTTDDDLLTDLITSCRRMVENSCNISIVSKTVTFTADLSKEWELPYGPVTGLQAVTTRQGNEGSGPGVYATLDSGWTTDGDEYLQFSPAAPNGFNPGVPFTGHFQWGPYASTQSSYCYRYRIVYTAGYRWCPADLVAAIVKQIAYDYEHRGNELVKVSERGLCPEAEALAAPFRRKLWF